MKQMFIVSPRFWQRKAFVELDAVIEGGNPGSEIRKEEMSSTEETYMRVWDCFFKVEFKLVWDVKRYDRKRLFFLLVCDTWRIRILRTSAEMRNFLFRNCLPNRENLKQKGKWKKKKENEHQISFFFLVPLRPPCS